MKKIFFVSLALGILLLSGCAEVFTDISTETGTSTKETIEGTTTVGTATVETVPVETPAKEPDTTPQDLGSTTITLKMTSEQAVEIAQKSDCVKEGAINSAKENFYNENSKTWWVGLDAAKEGCNPACVVSEEAQTAEINWRCTGLIVPKE